MKSNITSTVLSSGSSYSADGTAIATNHIDDEGQQTINRSYYSNESDASQVSPGNNLQMQSESRKVVDGFSENRNQRTDASALMSYVGDNALLCESSKNIFSPTKHRDSNSSSSGSSSIGRNDSPSRAIALSSVRVASDDLYSRALDGRLKSLSEPKIRESDCKVKNSFLSTPAVAATGSGSGSESSSIMGEVSGKVDMTSKGSKLLVQGQPKFLTAPQQKQLSATSLVALVVAYISVVAASYLCGVHPPLDYSNPVSQSPWIGEHNATKLINQRLQLIEARYQKVLVRDDWKMLRMSPNVTIETMSSEDGTWPGYIRTSAIFQAKPDDIMKYLGWLQFDETQKKVDRFHESSHLLFAPSHKSKVIRKTTQRPLFFPKREMTVALCEKTLRQSFTLSNLRLRTAPMKTFTSITIPKGTRMNAMVNVNVDMDAPKFSVPFLKNFNIRWPGRRQDSLVAEGDIAKSDVGKKDWHKQRDRKEKRIKAYQDMMGWFVPLEGGGTLLVFIMQVDLGPDIPQWAFFTALATTAVWSMAALNKLSSRGI